MEGVPHLVGEAGILREAVGHQDDVHQVLVDGVVETLHQIAAVAGHAAEADLALFLRQRGELPPLLVAHARDVVDAVVEVDVHVVGAQPLQAAVQRLHHVPPGFGGTRLGLGRQDDLLALALQRLADRLLGVAPAVALGGVEVVHAPRQGVADQRRVEGAGRAEGDVGDLELGLAEADVALDAGRCRCPGRGLNPGERERRAGPDAKEFASIDHAPIPCGNVS